MLMKWHLPARIVIKCESVFPPAYRFPPMNRPLATMLIACCCALMALASFPCLATADEQPAADSKEKASAQTADKADKKPADQQPDEQVAALLKRGKAIYALQCAECHGDKGQGVKDVYPKPLIGDDSLASLTRRIEETMPEGNPEACVGEEAAAVARYVYDTFYSSQARAAALSQLKPQLQRLTVGQFRRSVADLVGSFRRDYDKPYTQKRGLTTRVTGRHPSEKDKNNQKKWVGFQLPDSEPFIEIADTSPWENIDRTERISMTWMGAFVAEATGEHEFVFRTPNGFSVWFNDVGGEATPRIDGTVVSGEGIREEKFSAYLIAGTAYPVRLQWALGAKEPQGSFEMLYKPPLGPLQRVPARVLIPQTTPKVVLISTPFPPDDASLGYERGTAISAAWHEAVVQAAIEVAAQVGDDLNALAGTKSDDPQRAEKIRKFCEEFVTRALRRPLDDATRKQFIEVPFASVDNADLAARRVVLLTLCSARFLYPEAGVEQPDDYNVAARLALYLWDSLPDAALREAAARGELTSPEGILAQARRMLNDRRAKAKLDEFFTHWLHLERAINVDKDNEVFPDFDATLLADLRVSLQKFIDHVVWSEKSDYRELLQADYLFLNERLRKVYDAAAAQEAAKTEGEQPAEDVKDQEAKDAPAKEQGKDKQAPPKGDDFELVVLKDQPRSGVLTHPYLLTVLAYRDNTSPIHRGVFLTRNVVGRQLKAPPNAIEFNDTHFDPSLTMREKVTLFTSDSACMACHSTINALGFSLENFDGLGRFRTTERGKPIDAESDFPADDGSTVRLRGPRDVAQLAVQSPLSRRAFVRQLFQHTVKDDTTAFSPQLLDELELQFAKSDAHIRNILAELAAKAASYGLDLPAEGINSDTAAKTAAQGAR